MFDDHLLQICEREFEAKVKKLFEANQRSGKAHCEVPFLGGKYSTDVGGDHAQLQACVVDALIARQRFAWTGPDWMDELPLHTDRIAEMKENADPRLRIVGLYGRSLARLRFDYRTHPEFRPYCRGLMAYSGTPQELRTDSRLRKEFPPMKLDGLANTDLCWRTAQELAADKALQDWLRRMPKAEGLPEPEPEPEPEGARHRAGHC
jgi:hypothetical protein